MAQATPSLAPVMTLAKWYAKKAVIHDFQAAGIRYRELGAAQISLAACAYLSRHPELLARATETLAGWAERDRIRKEMRCQRRLREKGLAQRASTNPHGMGLSERQR